MENNVILNHQQQLNLDKLLKDLEAKGIALGQEIELWKDPEHYSKDMYRRLETKEDPDTVRNYYRYVDQFGVFQTALRLERIKAVVVEMIPIRSYGDYMDVRVLAKEGSTWFRYNNSRGRWSKAYEKDSVDLGYYVLAIDAYNTNILTLDENGKKPVPDAPNKICPEHNCAYHQNGNCLICLGQEYNLDKGWNKAKVNPALVDYTHDGIPLLNESCYSLVRTLEAPASDQRYIGEPLEAQSWDGTYWSGYSNFLTSGSQVDEVSLIDLDDCMKRMKEFASEEGYAGGFVLDYKNRTVYYDNDVALAYLQEKKLPKRKLNTYFNNFTKRVFL